MGQTKYVTSGSIVNDVTHPNVYGFGVDRPPRHEKTEKKIKLKKNKKLFDAYISEITFMCEDGDGIAIDFQGGKLLFTLKPIKKTLCGNTFIYIQTKKRSRRIATVKYKKY